MKTRTILVAGLGLIGGSIAKAVSLDQRNFVIGFDVSDKTLEFAKANEIIDEASTNIKEAAKRADVIILAAPISATIELIRELNGVEYSKDVILSDACSVKGAIMEEAHKLTNPRITFIGGHPMAGSHKHGIEAAKSHLFENAIYILSPMNDCEDKEMTLLKSVLEPTKSHFVMLKSEEHDEMTGVVSHFPHLIASSLVHQAKKWQKKHHYLPELAAGGFRDITRIASSDPNLWQDIFYHNEKRMSELLGEWIEEMQELKEMLATGDKEEVTTYLEEAKVYRDGLQERQRGAIPAYHDIYIDIRDQPGALAKVVQLLATHSINITNLRILEVREGIMGALRISVSSLDEQAQSLDILRDRGYEVLIES